MNLTTGTSSTLDSVLQALGDRINPILVKETRQVLKSRQFLVTFLLLLVASLFVSFGCVAYYGPGLVYQSEGATFFVWYYAVLAFAVFVVVPFGAFRSLSSEQEERTFELLAISALKPRQIVAGKLLSAVVQMFIYYSAIAPFMAFTVLLKGIDVPSILLVLFFSVLGTLAFSQVGLLLATLSYRRGWQVFYSVVITAALLLAAFLAVLSAASTVAFVGPVFRMWEFWVGIATALTVYGTYFWLAFELTAAQITFEADNRSSKIRVALVVQALLCMGWVAYWWVFEGSADTAALIAMTCLFGFHWFVVGSLLIAEPPGLSLRVARQVPRRSSSRALATLFFPGPGTGLAFLGANLVCFVALVALADLSAGGTLFGRITRPRVGVADPSRFALAAASYVFLYCGVGALVVHAIRRWKTVPALGGAAITWIMAAMGSLVPTFFALMLPNHRLQDYRVWQISDPIATLNQIAEKPGDVSLALLPAGLALLVFVLNLRPMSQAVGAINAAGARVAANQPLAKVEPSGEPARVETTAEPAPGV